MQDSQINFEVGWRMSDAESSSKESEIESDTDSENDSGGSSETETSMPGPCSLSPVIPSQEAV